MFDIKELNDEELSKVTGGVENPKQKYPNGSIFCETICPGIYIYYYVISYNGENKHYLCQKYTVDTLNNSICMYAYESEVAESELNTLEKANSIPLIDRLG